MTIALTIKTDLTPLHHALLQIGHKHLPFATALGLTRMMKTVQTNEAVEAVGAYPESISHRLPSPPLGGSSCIRWTAC